MSKSNQIPKPECPFRLLESPEDNVERFTTHRIGQSVGNKLHPKVSALLPNLFKRLMTHLPLSGDLLSGWRHAKSPSAPNRGGKKKK
ncbi:hypothetical protein CEXT_137621 [Caerostris extrusa]|uniref:Uncharacterized protein n=1 Tax=Caerostris extrusa TaxID=172846 RepID=A0AAV4Y7C2_CAEEX|nr:hypothetical protein CEXT_137621 [Caerostris extrusa]